MDKDEEIQKYKNEVYKLQLTITDVQKQQQKKCFWWKSIVVSFICTIVSFPQDVVWELKYPKFDIIGKPMEFAHGREAGIAAGGY